MAHTNPLGRIVELALNARRAAFLIGVVMLAAVPTGAAMTRVDVPTPAGTGSVEVDEAAQTAHAWGDFSAGTQMVPVAVPASGSAHIAPDIQASASGASANLDPSASLGIDGVGSADASLDAAADSSPHASAEGGANLGPLGVALKWFTSLF